jgi:glutamine amidotransferase
MITVLNFGLGNVAAFVELFNRLGIRCSVACRPSEIQPDTNLVLPGVGAFDRAMERLESSGLADATKAAAQRGDVPILGVCVGMQVLFDRSEEGQRAGLGLIPGQVEHLHTRAADHRLTVPHLGWNRITCSADSPLTADLSGTEFYFLHSYRANPSRSKDVLAFTDYGGEFPCIVGAGMVFGVQFHPEKSHSGGAALLRNFASIGRQ